MEDYTQFLDVLITRTLSAPRSAVWRAWAEPEYLARWWCPRPWMAEVLDFEFRSGGAFELMMRGPDDEEIYNPGLFLDVVPENRIVFTSVLSKGWRPAGPLLPMTAVITMEEDGDTTTYKAKVMHETSEDRQRHEDMGFRDGWETCIDQLEELAIQLV